MSGASTPPPPPPPRTPPPPQMMGRELGAPPVHAPRPIVSYTKSPEQKRKEYVDFLEKKLNKDLGHYFWKKYVASAFWAQMSMPINLTITLISAIVTGQANSPGLISETIYSNITIAMLVLTVINTFFRPHDKLQHNITVLRKWNRLGIIFEKIYYSDINNIGVEDPSLESSILDQYQSLQDEMNELRQEEGPESLNFLTDFIYMIAKYTCLKHYKRWIEEEEVDLTKQPISQALTVQGTAPHVAAALPYARSKGRAAV